MTYYVPSTPRHRGRSFSHSHPTMVAPSYPYPATGTPYSGYQTLAPSYGPGYNSGRHFVVAPSEAGRSRSRSRTRHAPGHGRSHGRSHSQHRSRSRTRTTRPHTQRRSHSTTSHRHQRPSHHVRFSMSKTERLAQFLFHTQQPGLHRPPTRITYPRQPHSPTIGERIKNFLGFGNGPRYVDQYGRPADNRGRTIHKY
jgi:hypothetical protein